MLSLDATSDLFKLRWLDREFGPGCPAAIFDFDGVLASPVEDLVYKLPEFPGERAALAEEAGHHGIVADVFDTRYLRHLVLQAVLEEIGELPTEGPLLPLAREMSAARRPFFILTARSGRAAIARLMAFVAEHRLLPQEVFCVGRVAKGRQLSLIADTLRSDTPAVYFEDTVRHARNSRKQDALGVETVHVAWGLPPVGEAEALLRRVLAPAARARLERSVA